MRILKFKLCYLFSFFLFFALKTSSQTGYELTKKMINSVNHINTCKFDLVQKERIGNKMIETKIFTKIQYNPLKIYYKQLFPQEGVEVLYVKDWNNNKAKVNPNSFPWVNLNLDANSEIMRKDQHHSLNESGFKYVATVLDKTLKKYEVNASSLIKIIGSENYKSRDCYKILFENSYYKNIAYIVKKNETITSIANENNINDYMILDKNKNIKNYNDISENQVIVIPGDYAKKMIILIDKTSYLPYLIQVFDDKGLYEQYEFSNIIIDPVFSKDEFFMNFKEYKFNK